jgi:hypothetical protein
MGTVARYTLSVLLLTTVTRAAVGGIRSEEKPGAKYKVECSIVSETHDKQTVLPTVTLVAGKSKKVPHAIGRPFIIGFRSTESGPEPIVQVLDEGVVVKFTILGAHENQVTLDAEFEFSEIEASGALISKEDAAKKPREASVQSVRVNTEKVRLIHRLELGSQYKLPVAVPVAVKGELRRFVLTVKKAE